MPGKAIGSAIEFYGNNRFADYTDKYAVLQAQNAMVEQIDCLVIAAIATWPKEKKDAAIQAKDVFCKGFASAAEHCNLQHKRQRKVKEWGHAGVVARALGLPQFRA